MSEASALLLLLADYLGRQDGVVSRKQALAAGLRQHDLDRLARRRLLVPLLRGVLVDHTGEPTWRQRAWGAVLATWPAAVAGESAIALAEGRLPGPRETVHLVVAGDRARPAPLPGVRVRHRSRMEETVHWHLGPPRQRLEEAVVDLAAAAHDEGAAVAVLAAAVNARGTTAARLAAAVAARPRLARRDRLVSVLDDVARGTCSVLEHGFLVHVERPHGLPRAERQQADQGRAGRVYRDAVYGQGCLVELDGRLHERFRSRDADMDRDLDAAAAGGVTVRLGYGQVFSRPCATAAALVRVLHQRGAGA
ncbi:hypothetical protein SAMN04488570_1250 [Nocardioides scoriae]|uniref:Transcriptional regulator, AbiEi antitoxin, Type IV TA system n=1 Tax=Nocardioides scoriae TaxID=642780 RepID=A0A1H1PVT1_9ACTN|nr:hypothetical protein [Nocardioides scoriae]SDS15340.1 hypothetical protein SAMN04488570_1250 [Nocardioides scoriae]